jgi:hypothetical protein
MATKKNIIVGAASVFIGPSGTVRPAVVADESYRVTMGDPLSTPTPGGIDPANWRDVGFTQDGLEISTDPSWGEVEVDQLLDSAKIFKDGMGLSISTTMAEATLENMLVAWGQPDSTLTEGATEDELVLDGGALGDAPLERGLIAVGPGPELTGSNAYSERTYHAFRVLSVEGATHTLARADATVLPVTFRALPEDDGKYGIVRDCVV